MEVTLIFFKLLVMRYYQIRFHAVSRMSTVLMFFGASRVSELYKSFSSLTVEVNFYNRIFLNSSIRNTV